MPVRALDGPEARSRTLASGLPSSLHVGPRWRWCVMPSLSLGALLALGLVPQATSTAHAAPMQGFTAGLSGGYLFIDPDEEISHAWAIVPRLGYSFGPRVGFEVDLGVHAGEIPALGMPYTGLTPRLDLMIDMAPDHWAQPFFLAGAGLFWKQARPSSSQPLDQSASGSRFVRQNPNTDPLANFGAGLLLRLDGPWFFRMDGRAVLHWGEDDVGYAEGFANWEITGGIAFRGGELKRDSDDDGLPDRLDPCPSEREDFDNFRDEDGCPDRDNDQDGVRDVDDECPDEEEDLDGYADRDGCPDTDNDGDGISDWNDACPDAAEDGDGFDDKDGCPENDNDNDGVPDELDRCPSDAEDRDGFEDSDGCPDTDNDSDGIPDSVDRCPSEAENINGVDDEDGCPDEAAPDLFDGVIPGVNFESGRDKLTVESYKVLDEVADLLGKHAYIRIEVQGHTDSDGSARSNLDLSARRARTVVEYLINRGVEPSRLEYVGYGESTPLVPNDSPSHKAVNRRVEFRRLDQPAQ